MKRHTYIISLLLCLLGTIELSAQKIEEAWMDMPAHITPYIGQGALLDMIDLYNAGMKACASTFTGDTAQLYTLGDTYLHMRTSRASTLQIKQIKEGKKTLYVVITTIEGPVPNSHIDLYDEHWQLTTKPQRFTPVTVADFIDPQKKKRKERELLVKQIILPTIQYSMCEPTNDIIATPSFMQTLDEETRHNIQENFYQQLILQWKRGKWKINK